MGATEVNPEILLRLQHVPGVGPNKIRALVARFGFSERIFSASVRELCEAVDRRAAEEIKRSDGRDYAREQLEQLKRHNARLVSYWDDAYPALLKQIYDPPAFLFVKGEFREQDRHAVAVVGTRQPTRYGQAVAERLSADLARHGLTIVSGLAYGIDTLAHRAALNVEGRTLAVLGTGVDLIYPQKNRKLAERIVSHGALISEFPMGTPPDWTNFPRRNRLISGLSLGTAVVEAGQRSGALITAAMALDQNREVFAVPGNIDSPKSVGTNGLIKQGAKVVTGSEDILEELRPHLHGLEAVSEAPQPEVKLTEAESRVLQLLGREPKHIDLIAKELAIPTSTILAWLLSLELKNLVRQLPGKQFVRS